MFDIALFLVTLSILILLAGIMIGRHLGVVAERARCSSLVSQSWQREGGALDRVWLLVRIHHSIERGDWQLVTVDEFFGKEEGGGR